jgi:DNA-binding transcriptional ArsR family regulator
MLRERSVADLFFALGDETRLSLVTRLCTNEQSATALADGAKVTRQAIVKHLQVLEGAGLVKHKRRGREVLYVVQPKRLDEVKAYIEMISASWDRAIARLQLTVEGER